MRPVLPVLVALALAPFAVASHGGAHSCGSADISILGASCTFECEAGQSLSAWVGGLGYARASCGGASFCSLEFACGSSEGVVVEDGWGTCEARAVVFEGYACSSSP